MTVLLMIAFDAVIIVTWSLLSPAIPSGKTFKVPFIGEIYYLTSSSSLFFYLRLVYPFLHQLYITSPLCLCSPPLHLLHRYHHLHLYLHLYLNISFFRLIAGDIMIADYSCNSSLAVTFSLILIAYKAGTTGVGAVIAFRVRSLGTYHTVLTAPYCTVLYCTPIQADISIASIKCPDLT
jgi:hypothetical protein